MKEGFVKQRCPKCGGNVYLDRDEYGYWFEACLQCGFQKNMQNLVPVTVKKPEASQ